jgi:hypothetical protein
LLSCQQPWRLAFKLYTPLVYLHHATTTLANPARIRNLNTTLLSCLQYGLILGNSKLMSSTVWQDDIDWV